MHKNIFMENLMSVVKEANKNIDALLKDWKSEDDVKKYYERFYNLVKDQCADFNFFMKICITDSAI